MPRQKAVVEEDAEFPFAYVIEKQPTKNVEDFTQWLLDKTGFDPTEYEDANDVYAVTVNLVTTLYLQYQRSDERKATREARAVERENAATEREERKAERDKVKAEKEEAKAQRAAEREAKKAKATPKEDEGEVVEMKRRGRPAKKAAPAAPAAEAPAAPVRRPRKRAAATKAAPF